MKSRPKLKIAALVVAAALVTSAAYAHFPVRHIEWTRGGDGAPHQTCSVPRPRGDYWKVEVLSDGQLAVSDVYFGRFVDGNPNTVSQEAEAEVALLSWTLGGMESKRSITTEAVNYQLYGDAYRDILIGADDLQPALGADRAAVRVDADLSSENSYDMVAMGNLIIEYIVHWCVDLDYDGWCDTTDVGGLEVVFPPLRAAEQAQLAACLNDHHFQTDNVLVTRVEGQIGGVVDWAAEVGWAAACVTPDDPPTLPAQSRRLGQFGLCEEAVGVFFGDDASTEVDEMAEAKNYICNAASILPLDDGTEISGHQIRYRLDQARGAFPGFSCPATDFGFRQNPSSRVPFALARKNRKVVPLSPRRQLNIRTDVVR